ncbi:DUF5133 domain-containing protein [Streptomyces sp. NPDC091268]|uniref:DUF5133 domain-containing protein n=1 Tax=Streptomyces sp. NPDC091268 TaxID=3365979 RepID=UPI0038222B09
MPVPTPGNPSPSPPPPPHPRAGPDGARGGGHFLAAPATARAVGVLMAAVPCSAQDARRILATAADTAHVTVEDLASAVATAPPPGARVPASIERALRHAVEAARTPVPGRAPRGAPPAPNLARTEEVLTRLRGCRARLAAAPGDPGALRAMDDAAHTLCVLMGRPGLLAALTAAEAHLAALSGSAPGR